MKLFNTTLIKLFLTLTLIFSAILTLHISGNTTSFITAAQATEIIDWKKLDTQRIWSVYDVVCPNENGIMCLAYGTDGQNYDPLILKTTDGISWTDVNNSTERIQFIEVECPKTDDAYCIANGFYNQNISILISNDGLSWEPLSNIPPDTVYDRLTCPKLGIDDILCIAVGHENNGRAAIATTKDGSNWIKIENLPEGTNDNPIYMESVACPDTGDVKCVAFGSQGENTYFLTTSDGTNWIERTGFEPVHVMDVKCPKSDGALCVAAGSSKYYEKGHILTTTDGISWNDVPNLPEPNAFTRLACPGYNGDLCTAVGSTYSVSSGDGTSWRTTSTLVEPQGSALNNIICPNISGIYCYATGPYYPNYEAFIFATGPAVNQTNTPPTIEPITVTSNLVKLGTQVTASAVFSDPDTGETFTIEWYWGDYNSSPGTVDFNNGTGTLSDTHTYSEPGVYSINVYVRDSKDEIAFSFYDYIVVYDPDGGFVTGGGWISSPQGAYQPDPSLSGKASFGFVSKYQKGANIPTGNTEFNFKTANLNFKSKSLDWMIIAGDKAKFKGRGTINGSGDFKFMIVASDSSPDTFRIRIWDESDGGVIYDNENGAPDDYASTQISGGSIIIHK